MNFSSRGATQRCIRLVPVLTGSFPGDFITYKTEFCSSCEYPISGSGENSWPLGHYLLRKSMQGKACQCLVVSQSLVIPLLGFMEAESSWILPASGTAHTSAWHKDVFVSHFLQSYLTCDGIRTLFLPKLCKITSGVKTVGQSISVAGRTDFIINKI